MPNTQQASVFRPPHRFQAALECPPEHAHQILLHAFLVQAAATPPPAPLGRPTGVPGKNARDRVKRQQPSLVHNTRGSRGGGGLVVF